MVKHARWIWILGVACAILVPLTLWYHWTPVFVERESAHASIITAAFMAYHREHGRDPPTLGDIEPYVEMQVPKCDCRIEQVGQDQYLVLLQGPRNTVRLRVVYRVNPNGNMEVFSVSVDKRNPSRQQ
jgi:hypothetical protein